MPTANIQGPFAGHDTSKTVEVNVYIDNSNLWIQGQKAYARKKGMRVAKDPTWRVDVGRLLDVFAQSSGLRTEERTHIFHHYLFGSTPPPVDTLWTAIEAHNVHVSTFARSKWTGREKQVDQKITSKSVSHASKAYYGVTPCEIIIVSGDVDMLAAVETIRDDYEIPVHIWSWRDGLAHEYKTLQERDPDVTVHLLDDYLDRIGFCDTKFRIDRNIIDPHSVVILDPMPKAVEVGQVLSTLPIPTYKYSVGMRRVDAFGRDLVIIPAFARSMSYEQLESFLQAVKKKLELHGVDVLPYVEYCNVYPRGPSTSAHLEISEQFPELPTGDDEAAEGIEEEDDKDNGVEGDAENDQFIRVNQRSDKKREYLKKKEQRAREKCFWGLYCRAGKYCKRSHTPEQVSYFKSHPPKTATKYSYCRWRENCRITSCTFAHSADELFCPSCDTHGAGHEMKDCPERFRNTPRR